MGILKKEIHFNILDKKRQRILTSLTSLPFCKDFYLAGGTALALLINHRISLDFDFFSSINSLNYREREKIKKQIKKISAFKIITDEENTLDITIKNIQVSFFNYPYRLLRKPLLINKLNLASLEDIAVMKLAAAISRGDKKDYIDLYFLLQKISLEKLFRLAEKKFPNTKNFRIQALKSLAYFENAEPEKMPIMIEKVSWKSVKTFLEKKVTEYLKFRGI